MNILNYKEPVNFNENINNKLLFERFNVNKPLDNNNYMNFNFGNSFESCHYINFPTINENTLLFKKHIYNFNLLIFKYIDIFYVNFVYFTKSTCIHFFLNLLLFSV